MCRSPDVSVKRSRAAAGRGCGGGLRLLPHARGGRVRVPVRVVNPPMRVASVHDGCLWGFPQHCGEHVTIVASLHSPPRITALLSLLVSYYHL